MGSTNRRREIFHCGELTSSDKLRAGRATLSRLNHIIKHSHFPIIDLLVSNNTLKPGIRAFGTSLSMLDHLETL